MTGIFRNYDDPDVQGFDIDLVMMTMQASQCPVLVRRDPDGDWIVIAQGPRHVLHAHIVTIDDAIREGVPTVFDAAIQCAREPAEKWKRAEALGPGGPVVLAEILDALFAANPHLTDPREEHP